MAKIHPVLLAGGTGSRLWPLSRESLPKQYLRLVSNHTLFQEAALRVGDPDLFAPLRVIGSEQHRFLIAEQLLQIGVTSPLIVLEPFARNTTAAAAVAALAVASVDPESLMLLLPADHRIVDVDAFTGAVRIAAKTAESGFLSLFGIRPDRPSTGYGYIRIGEPIESVSGAYRGAAFVEKPDRETAESYIAGGDYVWNSGIFLLPVRIFLKELARFEPELLSYARSALQGGVQESDFLFLERHSFEGCRSITIDHAVMERTDRMAVIPVDWGWKDVGSWSTVAEMAERDPFGNTAIGEVLTEETKSSYIRSEGPLVATVGVENLIIIATPDAVLVAHKDHDQSTRLIVDRLRDGHRHAI